MEDVKDTVVRRPKEKKVGRFVSSANAPEEGWSIVTQDMGPSEPEAIDLSKSQGNDIAESTNPPFIFGNFLGRQVRFQLKNGDTVIGTVGPQRFQFVTLFNVQVTHKDASTIEPLMMLNVATVAYFCPIAGASAPIE